MTVPANGGPRVATERIANVPFVASQSAYCPLVPRRTDFYHSLSC